MVILRRRALALLGVAVLFLMLGVWAYYEEQQRLLQALGTTVDVVVTARDVAAWTPLTEADLALRAVPEHYAGPAYLRSREEAVGRVPIADLPKGTGLPAYVLYTGPDLQPGERTWELRHDGTVLLETGLQPGQRVDVLAAGRLGDRDGVHSVLQGARVLAVDAGGKNPAVTLAVTWEQAMALMQAENYARQVRVVLDTDFARAGGEAER